MPEAPAQRSLDDTLKMEVAAAVVLLVVFLGVSVKLHWGGLTSGAVPETTKALGIMVAAGLTLVMYSFLYRDNPFFKVVENLYVGIALGYGAVMTWHQALKPEVVEPIILAPSFEALGSALLERGVPIVLGFMLLTRISRKYSWPSRYSYAIMIGWFAGMGIPITIHTYILKQVHAAINPLFETEATPLDIALSVTTQIIVLVGTVSVLYYFFFSLERKGAGKAVSRVGIIFLMVSFGASYGYTVMGRISLLIGRVDFLLYEWLQRPRP